MCDVLILGRSDDFFCTAVAVAARARSSRVLFVPEEQLFPSLRFAWRIDQAEHDGVLGYGDLDLPQDRWAGTFARVHGLPVSAEAYLTSNGKYLTSEWNALVMGWLANLPGTVCNRLRPELWYRSRLAAAELAAVAARNGFRTPRTLATSCMADVVDFHRRCGGRVTYAPLTQPASAFPVRDAADLDRLGHLAGLLPFHLTEAVDGPAAAAYVVGGEVRFRWQPGRVPAALPDAVRDGAVSLARAFGLTFCRLDLVVGPDGACYVTALDRMPHLFDHDGDACRELAGLVADLLTAGRPGGDP